MPRLRLAGSSLPVQLALAASSGVLLFLANPPAGLWPLAFVALIPLLVALRGSPPGRGLAIGFTFGFAYFALDMYWILLFGELAWGGLACANAAFAAVFGGLVPVVRRGERPLLSAAGIAALWTAIEFLRGHGPLGGLTWGDAAYTQANDPFLLPLASVVGSWGVSFVVVLVNLLLLEAVGRRPWGRALPIAAVALALVLAPAMIPIPAPDGSAIDVAALQVRVPKDVALAPNVQIRQIAEGFASLHRTLAGDPPQLAVWPEDALDKDPTLDPSLGALVGDAIRAVGAPTLAGGIMGPPDGRQYNQGVLFGPQGTIVGRTSKVHLVPFGEYVPWRNELSFLALLQQIPRDLTPGKDLRTLSVDGITFGNAICFENSFPSISRTLVRDGAGFLVISTNNASYLATAASEQHLAMSRFRAVENARWVVHDAISGISAFIDPHGGVHQATSLFQPAIIRSDVRASDRTTLYTRLGDWFPAACLFFAVGLILAPNPRRRPVRPVEPLPSNARALVVLPTYNEAATIGSVIDSLLGLSAPLDILVVDDGSPDGTGKIVETLASDDSRLRLLARPAKSGLASAYREGFERALEGGYDLVVEMDSDLSHDPAELPALLDAARTSTHLAIGSRYVPGGSVSNWGRARVLLSKAGNRYARLCLGLPLSDSTSGYRAYRRDLLRHLLDGGVHAEGYGFQIELAFRAWKDGYAVGEVPITFREREHGHSKISRRIVLEALWQVTRWGARERFRRPGPDAT